MPLLKWKQTFFSKNRHVSPWLIWLIAASFYLIDYFARVAPAVMTNNLMRAFHVTAFLVGGLSSFFYWPYIAMQIPVGLLVDRFGAKRLLLLATIFCSTSCMWFAASESVFSAGAARALLGFASSFAFVGALKLGSLWFPPHRFGLIAGTTQALGMLGASFGQAPMAYFVEHWGWRLTMHGVGFLFLILLFFIAFLIKDSPFDENSEKNSNLLVTAEHIGLWQSFKHVIKHSQCWYNALYAGFLYAPTGVLGELWGASFLTQVYSISETRAAIGTMLIFIGWGVGGPFIGFLSDKLGRRRPVMLASAFLSLITLLIILYIPGISYAYVCLLLFLYGIFNTGLGLSYAVAGEITSHKMVGTSLAFANMASIGIGALLQPVIGKFLDMHWSGLIVKGIPFYTAQEFRAALFILPICLIISFLCALKIRETHCKIILNTEMK